MKRALIVTTINGSSNQCLQSLSAGAVAQRTPFIVAGDTKTPADFALPGCTYLSIEDQERRFPALGELLPKKHYTRKNIAYLAAMELGVDEIQETDDDNFPLDEVFWNTSTASSITAQLACGEPWANIYQLFADTRIWPRGLPLEFVRKSTPVLGDSRTIDAPLILQGLADGNPDVDAVFRMTQELPVSFKRRGPVMLQEGSWCPFNSQNTIFARRVFPLLYLPSYCTFRMTDIWRSFVAQRCVWELGQGIIFHEATVYQERNEHKLIGDFEDEVPGYLHNDRIRMALEKCTLHGDDVVRNLVVCYEKLVAESFVGSGELPLLRRWCDAVEKILL